MSKPFFHDLGTMSRNIFDRAMTMRLTFHRARPGMPLLSLCVLLAACGNDRQTAQRAINSYCELRIKESEAPAGVAKDAATMARTAYERDVDKQYIGKTAVYQQILEGMKECDSKLSNIK
jgi:hypothetical protein